MASSVVFAGQVRSQKRVAQVPKWLDKGEIGGLGPHHQMRAGSAVNSRLGPKSGRAP